MQKESSGPADFIEAQTIENSWVAKPKVWSEKEEEHVPRGVVHTLGSVLDPGAQGIKAAMQVNGSCFPHGWEASG